MPILNLAKGTVHTRLFRLDKEGLKGRYDRKSTGRLCKIDASSTKKLVQALRKSPTESGFERGSWTVNLVVNLIQNMFEKKYSINGALNLTRRLNFSVRKPRPISYKSATPDEQKEYEKATGEAIATYTVMGHKVASFDVARFVDSSASTRGIRPKGEA